MSEKDEILAEIKQYFEDNTLARDYFWNARTEEINAVIAELKDVKEDHKKLIEAVGHIDTFKNNMKDLNDFLKGAKGIIYFGKIIGGIGAFLMIVWNFFIKKKLEE